MDAEQWKQHIEDMKNDTELQSYLHQVNVDGIMIRSSANKAWGVMLVLDQFSRALKTLMNPDSWSDDFSLEDKIARVTLTVDDHEFSFTGDGEDKGFFYYIHHSEKNSSFDVVWIVAEKDGVATLPAAQRIAAEIKEMQLNGIRFLMVATQE